MFDAFELLESIISENLKQTVISVSLISYSSLLTSISRESIHTGPGQVLPISTMSTCTKTIFLSIILVFYMKLIKLGYLSTNVRLIVRDPCSS